MVLAYWGYVTDEVSLSMLCGTNLFGTSADQIVEAAQRLRFEGYCKLWNKYSFLPQALKENVPPIVAVDATILYGKQKRIYTKHDIVLLEIIPSRVVYHDSDVGQNLSASPALFKEAWRRARNEVILIWPAAKTFGKMFMKKLQK
jgi:hypothetical protein